MDNVPMQTGQVGDVKMTEVGQNNVPAPEDNEENRSDQTSAAEKEVIDLEEKRRRECLGNMEKIEKEFAELKEKFFAEKLETLKKEYELIKGGVHQGYLKKVQELEQVRENKIWSAEKWKEYQIKNIENIFESEKKQAEDEFKLEKRNLKDRMLTVALEKRKKLVEEKLNLILTDKYSSRNLRKRSSNILETVPTIVIPTPASVAPANNGSTTPTNGTSGNPDSPNFSRRRLNPPQINYTLKDSEILEDLALIQKGTALLNANSHIPQAHAHLSASSSRGSGFNSKSFFSTSIPRTESYHHPDVYSEHGKLHYHNMVLEKGKEIAVQAGPENDEDPNGKWIGSIVLVNPAEIHVKTSDGTKNRFLLSHLRTGKYTIAAS